MSMLAQQVSGATLRIPPTLALYTFRKHDDFGIHSMYTTVALIFSISPLSKLFMEATHAHH